MRNIFSQSFELFFFDLIGILIIYQSLIFGFFLLLRRSSKPLFIYTLLGIYLTLFSHFLYITLENHFFGKSLFYGFFFGFVYGPLFYLYTLSLILKNLNIKAYLWHFFPAIIAFFILFISHFTGSKFFFTYFPWLNLLVSAHILSYLSYTLLVISRYKKELPQTHSSFEKISLNWLSAIIYLIFAAILCAFAESFISPLIPYYTNILLSFIFLLILLSVNCLYYLGFRQVNLFPGLSQVEVTPASSVNKYELPLHEQTQLQGALQTYMRKEQPYKDFDLTLGDLAKALDVSPRKLSYIINEKQQMNFFEYINSFRLAEVKRMLETTQLPIKEIMYDSGFGNKSTFNHIFKKETGFTPSAYRKSKS